MKSFRFSFKLKIMISLSIFMIVKHLSVSCIAEERHVEKVDFIQLRKIDLHEDSLLCEIISKTISQDRMIDNNDSYQVFIHEYKYGYFVKIVKSKNNMLKTTAPYSGYSILKGHTIIFGITTNYSLHYSDNRESKFFRSSTARKYFSEDSIIEEWFYYIIDDIYATYDHSLGWMWSDGKPDE